MENSFTDSTRKTRLARRLIPALAVSMGLGLFAPGAATVFGQQPLQTGTSEAATPPPLVSPAELSRTFVSVAKRVKPAVVHINVFASGASQTGSGQSPYGSMDAPRARRGTGSGVIISPDGYILTNNHVAGATSELRVRLSDGRELRARRIGADPETDLALIKIEAQNLSSATLGDSSKLEQGEWVIALGSPFGFEQTMTAGIVSAIGRDFGGTYDNYIQTDASINPGNSGGPLVNMNGEVVGINTMIYSRSGANEGIGFSVPSNMAKKVQEQLLANGRVSRGFLGVSLQAPSSTTEDSSGREGALIGDLSPDGPAAKSGLRNGDVITEFDGRPVKSSKQLTEFVADTPVGKPIKLNFVREGHAQTTSITLAERPTESRRAPAPYRRQRRP
jgi:serine protease Do